MRPRFARRPGPTSLALAFLASGFGSCTGTVTLPAPPPGPLEAITCRGPAEPGVAPLHRLAIREYEAGLRALLPTEAVDGVADQLATLPVDTADEGAFTRQDHRLSANHVTAFYAVSDALAVAVADDPARRAAMLGDCSDATDDACLRAFLPGFLRQAWRREATGAEVDDLVAVAGDFEGADKLEAVLFVTLMSPDFLYRFENRGDVDGDVQRLTAYEVASRLSYHFWGAPPDDALLDAAASGRLDDEDGYAEEVERVYEDPRTDETILRFFEGWLHLERGAFVAGPRLEVLRDGMDTDGLHEEMRAELYDLIEYHLGEGGTWADVLTSDRSFARGERLASIYGVSPWDGDGEPPTLPADERSGLLTRAGVLYTADGSTNPFRRGIWLRRAVLCDSMPPPPTNIPAEALQAPPVLEAQSTRQAFENKVLEQPCAGCHARFTPLGYAMEAYDGFGRFRSEEWLVTDEGEDRGTVPVDARVIGEVTPGDRTVHEDAVQLSEDIAESGRADACLARRYFQFAQRREAETADECTVGSMLAHLEAGEPLRDALRAVALEPAFRQRRLED